FFLRGLTAILPAVLTVAIVVWVCTFIYQHIGRYSNTVAQWIVVQLISVFGKEPMSWWGPGNVWQDVLAIWEEYWLVWIGFVLAFVLIYIFGRFIASFIGKGVWRALERTVFRTPVVKQIYPHVKQVTDILLSDRKIEFSRVVAVEYPRKGAWSVGLVTSPGMKTLQGPTKDMLTVFIPSSPMPVTGYTVTVRRHEVIDLPLSIDEALRFTVSGGVVLPRSQQMDDVDVRATRQPFPASDAKLPQSAVLDLEAHGPRDPGRGQDKETQE
ncbi:MAG: DUF502 domain-containing protein, partial [Phycisphaerae bacterium]|nr:DUF502 domain-containing protein [Phycisphaerae bacterium]